MKVVALIPARSGSKRVPDKNVRFLNGHPLLAYTVRAAIDSGIFDAVVCATDSPRYAEIASYYGAEVPFLRPQEISSGLSPDVDWVKWIIEKLTTMGRAFDVFSILRPTSPFRMPETIQKAWAQFQQIPADSLRAVEKCKQHPGKMWVVSGNRMTPLLPFRNGDTPWHSSQYTVLPEIFVQNASLEISWTRNVLKDGSIAGNVIIPFISEGLEGFDINETEDWFLAEYLLARNEAVLPAIQMAPFHE